MHSKFRAPSSPLLLILGWILTAIYLILIYNPLGNTHLEKITTWYRQWAGVYAAQELCRGEWAEREMLGFICTQSNERSKAGPVIVQNYLILIFTLLFYSLFPCLLCCHKADSRYSSQAQHPREDLQQEQQVEEEDESKSGVSNRLVWRAEK